MSIQPNKTTSVNWDCPVCLDPLANAKAVMTRRCLHIFHEHCLKQSIDQGHKCPTCRNFGLNASELLECARIKGLYQSCVLGTGLFSSKSTLEEVLMKTYPQAKKVGAGYEVTADFGNGRETRIIKPHHLLRPSEYHGKPQMEEMTSDDIYNLVLEIQQEVSKYSKIMRDPNISNDQREEAHKKLVRLDKEFDEAMEADRKTFPKRQKEFNDRIDALRKSNAEIFKAKEEKEKRKDYQKKLDEKREALWKEWGKCTLDSPEYKKIDQEIDAISAEKRRLIDDPSYKPYLNPKEEPKPEVLSSEEPIQNKPWTIQQKLLAYGLAGLALACVLKACFNIYQNATDWWYER